MESPNAMQRSSSKSNNKLLMCFKPVTMDEEDGVVLSAAGEDGGESHRKKKGWNRWQALREALRGTSLMKKAISRRKANKDRMSRSNSNLEDNKIISSPQFKSTRRTTSNASSTIGRCSPALTSSTSIGSTSSLSGATSSSSRADCLASISSSHDTHSPRSPLSLNDRTEVTKHQQIYIDYRREGCYYGTYTATCMLLISFLFLVTWGKCLAILYTSLWFYMVRPVRRRPCNYKEYGPQSGLISDFDSVQYKRKIIMEGLLERSHSNVSLASCSTRGPVSLASSSMRKSHTEKVI